MNKNAIVKTGGEVLIRKRLDLLQGKRVGLVTNHSAVVEKAHLIDLLYESEIEIIALFGPEHGMRGDAEDCEKVEDSIDEKTGTPIFSLYGAKHEPSSKMLENVDVLIFDIQDIGARFYTYTSTLGYALQAAAEHNIPFIVLDRPNPLGGNSAEGFVLEPGFETFLGLYPIPISHGLTVGELAMMIKGESMLDGLEELDLQVVQMKSWRRDMLWPETGMSWISPSPNIPTFETALIYSGACFFERTSASEGRGTQNPFIQLGAPWVDGKALASELNNKNLPGLKFESVSFTPKCIEGMDSNPEWEGVLLEGIRYHVTNPYSVKPVAAGIHVLQTFYTESKQKGEYNFLSPTVKKLAGTDRLYKMVEAGKPVTEIIDSWVKEVKVFKKKSNKYFLYD